jgi:hypothetical protein
MNWRYVGRQLIVALLWLLLADVVQAASPFGNVDFGALHSGISDNCVSCHNGRFRRFGANSKKDAPRPGHIPSSNALDCSVCHIPWTTDQANEALKTWKGSAIGDTAKLHEGVAGDGCSKCHSPKFKNLEHRPSTVDDAPGGHIPYPRKKDCGECHSASFDGTNQTPPKPFVAWTGGVMDHAGITKDCQSCHDGVRAKGIEQDTFTDDFAQGHMPLRPGQDCVACHRASIAGGYLDWTGSTFDAKGHRAVGATTNCIACHADGARAAASTESSFAPHVAIGKLDGSGKLSCESCHAKAARSFADWKGGVMAERQHADLGITEDRSCGACHGAEVDGQLKARGIEQFKDHIETGGKSCELCHVHTAPVGSTWKNSGGLDAAGHEALGVVTDPASSNCASCHDGRQARGKEQDKNGHLPTEADCGICHQDTVTRATGKYGDWTNGVWDHATETGNCIACHDDKRLAGKGQSQSQGTDNGHVAYVHFPTGDAPCEACHLPQFTGAPAPVMPETADWGKARSLVALAVGPAQHLELERHRKSRRIIDHCDNCHIGGVGQALDHTQFAQHIDTLGQSCERCHQATAAGSNGAEPYVSWAGGTYGHKGIRKDCARCHDGVEAAGQSGPDGSYRHFPTLLPDGATQAPCERCHAGSIKKRFSDWKTGLMGEAQHAAMGMRYQKGEWSSTDCGGCHDPANWVYSAVGDLGRPKAIVDAPFPPQWKGRKPVGDATGPNHIDAALAGDCGECHTSAKNFAKWKMFHSPSLLAGSGGNGGCSGCHAGIIAKGTVNAPTPPGHIPLDQPEGNAAVKNTACGNCHVDPAKKFRPARMSHAAADITTGCVVCHDGRFRKVDALGKPKKHIPTEEPCEKCHSPVLADVRSGFKGMDHKQVLEEQRPCAECHDSAKKIAKGKPRGHVPTDADCLACHQNVVIDQPPYVADNWEGAVMDHIKAGIVLLVAAKPQPQGVPCADCHDGASHLGRVVIGRPPTKANGNLHPVVGACENCHRDVTIPGGFKNAVQEDHTGRVDGCGAAGCHDNKSAQGRDAGHIPNPANQPDAGCESCHQKAMTTSNGWPKPNSWQATGYLDHEGLGVSGDCETCHVAKYAAAPYHASAMPTIGTWPKAEGSAGSDHIPNPGGLSCENCHLNFSSFTGAKMDHSGIVIKGSGSGATASFACVRCHTGTTQNNVLIVGQINDTNYPNDEYHLKNGNRQTQCQQCHSTSTFGGASNHQDRTLNPLAPYPDTAVFSHQTAVDPRCDSCHAQSGGAGWKMANHVPPNVLVQPSATNTPGLGDAIAADCYRCHRATTQSSEWPQPLSFAGGSFDHLGLKVTGNCNVCHDAVGTYYSSSNAQGMNAVSNHIPTTASCESCHGSSVQDDFSSFVRVKVVEGSRMNHGVIGTAACSNCHKETDTRFANQTVKGKPANHLPTTLDCDSSGCHGNKAKADFSNFANTQFDHAAANVASCAGCHTGASYAGNQVPLGKSALANHVATTADCSQSGCHDQAKSATHACASGVTGAYQCWSDGQYPHTSKTGCSSCHAGTGAAGATLLTAAHIPVKTTSSCETCHKTALSGATAPFTEGVWTGSAMDHAAVDTARCANCHGATFQQPANYQPTDQTAAKDTSGAANGHIPLQAGQDCKACHTDTVSFANWTMSHAGITSNCSSCHSDATQYVGKAGAKVTTKPAGHINVVSNASVYDLAANPATLTPVAYPASGGACENCHSTTNFSSFGTDPASGLPTYTMSHEKLGVTQGCADCHKATGDTPFAGQVVKGKPLKPAAALDHIPDGKSSAIHSRSLNYDPPCEVCHSAVKFTNFTGTATNHPASDITQGCETCHGNGKSWFGTSPKSPNSYKDGSGTVLHVDTTEPCLNCHQKAVDSGYTAWSGGTWTHSFSGAPSGCASCHDGTKATGTSGPSKTFAHIPLPSGAGCESCHQASWSGARNYDSFAGGQFDHENPAWKAGFVTGKCASCHISTYATSGAVAMPAIGSWPKAVNSTGSEHIPNPGNLACEKCHKTFTSFTGAQMDHSGITVTGTGSGATASYACANCHVGTTQNSVLIVGQVNDTNYPNDSYHLKAGVRQTQCQQCHTTTTFGGANDHQRDTSGNPNAPYANSSVFNNLTTVTPPCGSCHAESGGAGWKMANHIPPNVSVKPTAANTPGLGQAIDADCYRCHRSTTQATPWPVPVSFSGGSFDHIGLGVTGNCNVCHDATGTYYASSNAQGMNAVANHIPTTASCENCHKSAVAADFADFAQIKTVQGSPMNHGVIGTAACTSCHKNSDTLFANQTVKGKPANHMPTTLDCGTSGCHDNKAKAAAGDANAYANFANTRLDHAKASLTANCASCHSGATWAGSQTPKSKTSITGHVTTTQDCSASGCHAKAVSGRSAATSACASAFGAYQCWGDGLYPHTETTGCSSCHTGSGAYGATVQTGGHIPVKAGTSCELCHLVSVNGSTSPVIAKYTVWSSAVIQHSGVDTASCVTCHGDSNVFSQPAGYQPTNKASFFKGVGVARTPVTPAHVATTADCRTCHSASTTSYVDWKNAGYDHQGVTTGCGNSGCHNGSNGPPRAGKSATDPKHLTTTQDCSLCHLASFGSGANAYQAWGGATMKHTGINFTSQPCNSCHADKTVATPPTYRFQGPTPPGYIEPTTTAGSSSHQATGGADCQSCHSASLVDFASWGGAGFDHKDSGTPSGYKTSGCNASGCHDGSNAAPKSGKPAGHVPTTADCAGCHTNAYYPSTKMYIAAGWAGTKMNHTTLAASERCDGCHGKATTYLGAVSPKTTANVPSLQHIPIDVPAPSDCKPCHQASTSAYASWINGKFHNRSGVTSVTTGCASCHTPQGTTMYGMTVGGKFMGPTGMVFRDIKNGAGHISNPANLGCEKCHTGNALLFTTWEGTGIGMSHSGITTNCKSCHDGYLAMGAPPSNPGSSARFPNVASPAHGGLSYVNSTACEVCHYNGGTITAYSGSTLNSALWKTKQVGWNTSTRKFVTLYTPPATTATPPGIAPQCGAWHQGTSPLADTSCITCHGAATVASGTASVLINPWMGKGPKSNSAGHEGGGSCLTGCHEHSRPSANSCSGF